MRSFVFTLLLLFGVNLVADAASTVVQYPMATVQDPSQVGVFLNRQRRVIPQQPEAQPGVPDAGGNRTAPVDPNAAPKFEAAPADGGSTLNLTAMTPEQKQQLFTAISSIVSALLGAFAGSGKMAPFLSALLGAFKTIAQPVPPAPVAARVRARRAKAKPKAKAAAPESK